MRFLTSRFRQAWISSNSFSYDMPATLVTILHQYFFFIKPVWKILSKRTIFPTFEETLLWHSLILVLPTKMQRTSSHKCVTIVTPITKRMGFFVKEGKVRKKRDLQNALFHAKSWRKGREKCWIVQLSRLFRFGKYVFYWFGIKVCK